MFSYQKIVFGIKHQYHVCDVMNIFTQQCSCSILISEHCAMDVDDCCDRPDVHYHGLAEFNNGESKIKNSFMQISPYCIYINDVHCNNPAEYMAYVTLAPKRIIYRKFLDSSKLLKYLQTASSMKLEVLSRKKEKKRSLIERNFKIVKVVEILLESGYIGSVTDQKNEPCWARLERLHCFEDGSFETAQKVSQKIVLNSPILVLSNRFGFQDNYLSPEESFNFVLNWCSYQKLNPKEFIENLIRCLDKRGGNRNSIYFQGSSNSGKTYIVQSIIEACIHVGQVIVESTSYSYVWEKCVDKRLIVLKEPHFSILNFDQLDKILSGSGTLIYKHNDVVDYLPPTPVIILANEYDWIYDPELSEKIRKRFLCCYMNLMPFTNMNVKKLHPRWLNLMNEAFCRSSLESDSDTNEVLQFITEQRCKSGDKKLNSSLKTSVDGNLLTKLSMDTKQDSGNKNQPYSLNRRRPMRDDGQSKGKNKMKRDKVILEE